MRCADFRVFSPRVQGPQPLPPTAQVIPPSSLGECAEQELIYPATSI
jgi:hypothetical protein